eukprot:scaffold6760_cov119-Isochrysis_galbana.AAC.1
MGHSPADMPRKGSTRAGAAEIAPAASSGHLHCSEQRGIRFIFSWFALYFCLEEITSAESESARK